MTINFIHKSTFKCEKLHVKKPLIVRLVGKIPKNTLKLLIAGLPGCCVQLPLDVTVLSDTTHSKLKDEITQSFLKKLGEHNHVSTQ